MSPKAKLLGQITHVSEVALDAIRHIENYRVVGFDLFGTLIHMQNPQRVYERVLQSIKPARLIKQIILHQSLSFREFVFKAAAMNPKLIEELSDWEEALTVELRSIDFYPGVSAALGALRARGLQLAVISNLAFPYAEQTRPMLQPLVDEILFSCELGSSKPDPALFHALLKRCNCSPAQVLFVGDSYRSDVLGATAVGIDAIWVQGGGNA